MRIIFFGTPDYVLPILNKIHKEFVTGPGKSPIVAVVTQEPKPVGRKQILTYSPVDKWAHDRNIPVIYDLNKVPKADLGIVASYGRIIPKFLISNFKFEILNIHPSLLPKYRGASPIQASIIAGDKITGVTIIKMDEGMDTGDIVTQFKEEILETDTFESLRNRLFEKSASVLTELIEPYMKGKIKLKKQNNEEATVTKIITKQDGFVDLKNDTPIKIERMLRAYTPWPGIYTILKIKNEKEKRLKILEYKNGPITVQLEGKTPVSWIVFKRAYL